MPQRKMRHTTILSLFSVQLTTYIKPEWTNRGIIPYPRACCRPDLRHIKLVHFSPDIASISKDYHTNPSKEGKTKFSIEHQHHISSCWRPCIAVICYSLLWYAKLILIISAYRAPPPGKVPLKYWYFI